MIRMILLLASIPFLLAACMPKAPVVVVISVDRVAREAFVTKKIIQGVENYAKSLEDRLNQLAQAIQAASNDPLRDPAEVNLMKVQLDEMRREASEQVEERRLKAEDDIHKVLGDALQVLAKEQGWSLVIRKDRKAALWAAATLDKTDIVIQRMNSSAAASAAPHSSI